MTRLFVYEGHQYAEGRLPVGVDSSTLPTSEEWFAAAKATAVEPAEDPATEAQPAEPAEDPASAVPVEPAEVKARRSK